MRNFWSQIPAFRIALAFMAGIGIEIYTDAVLHQSALLLTYAIVLFVVAMCASVLLRFVADVTVAYRLRVVDGIVLACLLISFGYILTWLNTEKNFKEHFKHNLQPHAFLTATIVKPPLEKEKVMTVVADVREVRYADTIQSTRGNILLNFLRDSLSQNLAYGDVIVFSAEIQEFDEPKNPEEFNFKLYQSFHKVYNRAFLKAGDWQLLEHNKGNAFMAGVYRLRDYFLSVIQRYVTDKNDFAVASAIMLGYNDYMNGDILRAYASTGALHVLSVSGLHVGIMFFMLNIFFKGMDNKGRKMAVAKAIIIISIIWFYACLTGLSPSVLRSAAMFSMIQLGKVLLRNVNTYNIIFASALVLMLLNPFIVTEVGFRLSYLAVIGIVYLHPKIYGWWLVKIPDQPKHKSQTWYFKPIYFIRYDLYWGAMVIVDWLWQIMAVSLAAQIATCALSLFYFHQFPNLFMLSNLLIIPASNLILFTGTGLMVLGEIPYLNDLLGWCFTMLLHGLNWFVFMVDQLPYALIEGISINMVEMVALYFFILLVCGYLYEKWSSGYLVASLAIAAALFVYNGLEIIQESGQEKIVVYAVPKQSAVAFVDGRKVTHHFDERLLNNRSSMLFHVRHHWWSCGITKETATTDITDLPFGKLIVANGKKILQIDTAIVKLKEELPQKLKVDLVILSHNPKVYLGNLEKAVEFKMVVFDSSNKPWRTAYWKKDCEHLQIKYWDVNERGSYISDSEDTYHL